MYKLSNTIYLHTECILRNKTGKFAYKEDIFSQNNKERGYLIKAYFWRTVGNIQRLYYKRVEMCVLLEIMLLTCVKYVFLIPFKSEYK